MLTIGQCAISVHAQDVPPTVATVTSEGTSEDLSFASSPAVIARQALGGLAGSISVGVWRAGRAEYAGISEGRETPPDSVSGPNAAMFEIGSISKVFTGLLLAQAVERGDLGLDDTLGKLLAGKASLTSPNVAAVTLRQLITHTSCLPRLPSDFRDGSDRRDPYRSYGRDRMWKALAGMTLTRSPPCEPVYSNLGVAMVGELLSERYGVPWDELIAERITGPLGMHDTVRSLGEKRSRLAPAFQRSERVRPWEFDAFRGAGSLHSTPADLLRFGRALMAGKAGPLGPAAERLLKPLGWFEGEIGYAIFIRGPEEHRTYLHTGLTAGYASQLILAPDTDEVVVILASNSEAPVFRVGNDLLSSRYPVTPTSGGFAPDPSRLAEFAGVYQVDPTRRLTYTAQDGVLYYHFTGGRFFAMRPAGPDAFTIGTRAMHRFEMIDGKPVSVTASAQGADYRAARTEAKPPAKALLAPADLSGLVGADLSGLVGTYKGRTLTFDVRNEGGQLTVRVGTQRPYPVFFVGDRPDHYTYDVVQAELQFERYSSGEARSIQLLQNGVRIDAVKE